MAKQSYDYSEIFGFDKLEKLIRQLDGLFVQLQQNGTVWLERIEAKEKDVLEITRKLNIALKNVSLDDSKVVPKLQGIDQEVDKAGKKLAELQAIAKGLTTTIDANEVSIASLKAVVKLLTAEYEKLNPQSKTFAQDQKDLAAKVNHAKTAITGQSSALKGLNGVLASTDKSYQALTQQTNALWKQLKNLDNAFDLNTGALNKNNKAAVDAYTQIQKNRQVLKDIDAQLGQHTRNVGNYGSGWQSAKGDLLAFVGVTTLVDTALRAITASFEVINSFDRYRSVIKFASQNTAEFSGNLSYLEKLADKTGTNIEVLYQKFGSFSVGAREAGFTLEQTRKIFGSLVMAGGALKMSDEAVERSIKAISDAVSKGTLQMEELKGQLGDHLPGALNLFAKGLGVSTEKLTEMLKKGVVISKETLPLFAEQLEKTFGKEAQNNVNTISGSWNRATNQLKLFIDEFAQQSKITSFFSSINNGVANVLKGMRDAIKSNDWMIYMGAFAVNPINGLRMLNERGKNPTPTVSNRNDLTGFGNLSAAERKQNILRIDYANQENKLRLEKMKIGSKEFYQLKDQIEKEDKLLANMIQTHEKLILAKKNTAKATSDEADKTKALRKEMAELRVELRNGGNGYTDTAEGAKKLERFNTIKAQLKKIDIEAGIANPAKIKEELSEVEKMVKAVGKLSESLMDDALGDVKNSRLVKLPEESVKKWYEMYDILNRLSQQMGVEIPSSIEKTKASMDRLLGKDVLTKLGEISPLSPTGSVTELKSAIKTPDTSKLPGVNDVLNITLRQETERLNLQSQFSGRLRRLKEEEKKELLRILAEIQQAEREGDKEKERRLKEQYDLVITSARNEEKEKQRIREEYAQAAVSFAQATNELYNNIQDGKVEQLEKQRDYELKMVGDNEAQKTAITEKYARQITEIRRKQAVAEKAMAVFQIGVNTAMAIMKIWAEFPKADFGVSTLVFSALAGITGALQAAAVMAKPLPAFKDGTMNAPQGAALVGEAGPELRESRGKYWLYDKPTVTNLNQGDKIYTASQTSAMLAQAAIRQEELERLGQVKMLNQQASEKLQRTTIINAGISKETITKGVAEGIKEIVIHQTSFDEDGVRRWIVTKNAKVEQQKKRMRLKE